MPITALALSIRKKTYQKDHQEKVRDARSDCLIILPLNPFVGKIMVAVIKDEESLDHQKCQDNFLYPKMWFRHKSKFPVYSIMSGNLEKYSSNLNNIISKTPLFTRFGAFLTLRMEANFFLTTAFHFVQHVTHRVLDSQLSTN